MAGLFGWFDVTKEGPGIEKDGPNKKTFFLFFETFFRNIWKFIFVNAVYLLVSLPVVTNGLANAGITHVTRNTARDKHSFGVSDFFETIKKNWRQSLAAGIINAIVYALIFFGGMFYYRNQGKSAFATVGVGICLFAFIVFSFMNFYIWTLIITFSFKLSQVYQNSFKFVFLNLKNNFICGLSLLAVYAVNVVLVFTFKTWTTVLIEAFVAILAFPGFRFLLIQYCTFPAIKKFIIDPYYKEHPNEDLDKRRDLGIEIE